MTAPRALVAKFAGTCQTCRGRFPAGAPILWQAGAGATHADPSACAAVLAAPAVEAAAPIDAAPIVALLAAAKDRGLKFPKARFLAPDGRAELRLSIAGAQSRTPGHVQVVIDGAWQGRIAPDGATHGPGMTAALASCLATIAAAPAVAAKTYAALTSRCSFCHLALTDAGSVAVGYGPVCAARYGLPHTAEGTPALTAAALDAAEPEADYGMSDARARQEERRQMGIDF